MAGTTCQCPRAVSVKMSDVVMTSEEFCTAKMSTILRATVAECEAIERGEVAGVALHMGVWVNPGNDHRPCYVCMAGAMMIKMSLVSRHEHDVPNLGIAPLLSYPNVVGNRLGALDELRLFETQEALILWDVVGTYDAKRIDAEAIDLLDGVSRNVRRNGDRYEWDKYRELADLLERNGL